MTAYGRGGASTARRAIHGVGPVLLALGLILIAALLPPALAAAALGALAIAAVIFVQPVVAVYLLAVSVPYESLHEVQFGGLNATATEFLAFCGGAAFLLQCAIRSRMQVRWAWWRGPLLLFAAVMVASMSQATDLKLSIKEVLKLGEMLLTYLLVLKYVDTPARLRRLLYVVVLMAISEALLGIVQSGAHFGPASFARGLLLRSSGTFDQPNPFAGYLNLTLPLLIAAAVAGRRIVGGLTLPALVILALGVLLSVSRGALLASLAAFFVIVVVNTRRGRALLSAVAIALFALVTGAVFGIVPASVTNQVTTALGVSNVDVVNPTPVTWAVAERLAHMLAGLHMFQDHPWLGVGIGNYPAAYPRYQVARVWVNPLGHAHNYYINIAAEAGVVGLAAFLIVLVSAFVIAARLYRGAGDDTARVLALGTIGVLTTVVVHSFFDDIFVHAMEAQVALVVGIATVACRLSVEGRRQEVQ